MEAVTFYSRASQGDLLYTVLLADLTLPTLLWEILNHSMVCCLQALVAQTSDF